MKTLVLGHRGAAGLEPENTLASFKKALDIGVNFIEFDVRACKDELVVIHDKSIDRTTNGKGLIKDFTFEELKKFDAGKGQRIPSLKEVLEFLKNKKVEVFIEIKEPNTLKRVIKEVEKAGLEKRTTIVSFYYFVVKKVKALNKSLKSGWILAGNPRSIVKLKEDKIDFLIQQFSYTNKEIVEECHKNKIKIVVWTVNNKKDIEKMLKLGVDVIVSNYPDKVLNLISRNRSVKVGKA